MRYNKYIKEVSNTIAFWISRKGEVVPVTTNHIATVIENPSKFGVTTEYIEDLYAKYGESMGQEGKAREEIIVKLIKDGWIRVRRYRNQGWSINIPKMTKKVKDILFDFANKIITKGIGGVKEVDKYMPVNVQGFLDKYNRNVTIGDIANDVLFEENETFDDSNAIVIVESIDSIDTSH